MKEWLAGGAQHFLLCTRSPHWGTPAVCRRQNVEARGGSVGRRWAVNSALHPSRCTVLLANFFHFVALKWVPPFERPTHV